MAQFPPIDNHIYKNGDITYKVTSVEGNNINCVVVDQNGSPIGSPQIIKRKNWEKGDYVDISMDSSVPTTKTANASSFSFSYDPETGDIVITHPDGIKTDRIKGLKGKDGESVFAEWCKSKGISNPTQQDWEDFLDSLRGEPGKVVNGKDGLSAFEVWKSIQPNGENLTEKDFFEFLAGEPGKNGHEGVDGKDGDTWKPYVSKDGILYFENTRTGERTEPVNIKGLQGPGADKGQDGDTWEPYFPDDGKHQLYFKNGKGEILGPFDVVGATGKRGPQGARGESAYQIWKNEGHDGDFHDFLLWIAKQAQKGEDGNDGDTFRPHVEKGHLFFISTKTGERIDGGCVIGPKGETGETGLNGHNVTHKYGYKEIYDWTCPVQEINPHLLTSSDDLASGGSAEEHMNETLNRIDNLRDEGKKLVSCGPCEYKWINKLLYFAKNPLKEFFWWCSGADRPLLRMCPGEHSKYMGIGTVIFFTALMAMVSSFFAISYVFGNHTLSVGHDKFTVCVIFAIFWGLMIFFLDRFITNTMYSDGKVTISWLELRSALPRILISIFLGIVISAPLELKIFNQEINDYIKSEAQKSYTASLYDKQSPFLGNFYLQCKQDSLALSRAIAKYETTSNLTPEKKAALYTEYYDEKTTTNNPTSYKDADGNNRHGRSYSSSTTRKVVPSETAYIKALKRDSINWRNAEIRDSISRGVLQSKIDSLISVFNPNKAVDNAGLYERLAALHAIAFHEDRDDIDPTRYEPWPKDTETYRFWGFFIGILLLLIIVSLPFTANVTKPSNNQKSKNEGSLGGKSYFWWGAAVLWPWFAVVALICAYCNNAFFNALPYYIFSSVGMIMMLFILIDVSPVFYKMMLADGQYEQYLHKEKSITQDLVRLNFAKSIVKVNESEIGRLAPLIFSKPFEKIKEILQGSKQKESLEWTEDENGEHIRISSQTIRESNEEVFNTVLGMKKAIIEASYQAWYRDMRDAIIGMHKPGNSNGGNAPINEEPNDPDDPSARARRETGHHTSDDEPFDEENYYGRTTGTSPDYDASSDDEYPETPEDILNGHDAGTQSSNPGSEDLDEDNISDDSDSDIESDDVNVDVESDDATPNSEESSSSNQSSHPDADVESEVEEDEDDETINPK